MAGTMQLYPGGALAAASTPAASTGSSPRTRFVLVNGRVPRADANCALCCAKIEGGYLRDPQTRLVYCNPHCFTGHEKVAMALIVDRSRRAS
jgi:hypothetical protein